MKTNIQDEVEKAIKHYKSLTPEAKAANQDDQVQFEQACTEILNQMLAHKKRDESKDKHER